MNENVMLTLDFKGLPTNYYSELKELLLNLFGLRENTATVYIGNAGTVRNAISRLNQCTWFQRYISTASLIIDGVDYNITDKLNRFNKLVIYIGSVDKKESLKRLVSSASCDGVII